MSIQEQTTILNGMKTRVQQLETTTTQLTNPTPPASTVKAITDGAKVSKKAADDSIYARAAYSGVNRYSESLCFIYIRSCLKLTVLTDAIPDDD